jgi:hypothetical protein
MFLSGGCESSGVLSLPAPAKQPTVTLATLTLLGQVTGQIKSPRVKRAARIPEPSGFSPQKIRMVGGVTDPFDVRWLRLV